jgi:hypothetical protein
MGAEGYLERQGPGANYNNSGTHFFANQQRTMTEWLLRGGRGVDLTPYEGHYIHVTGCLVPGYNSGGPNTTGFLEVKRVDWWR